MTVKCNLSYHSSEIQPVTQTLYPTSDSLQVTLDKLMALVPEHDYNHVYSIVMTYHNTLISKLENPT